MATTKGGHMAKEQIHFSIDGAILREIDEAREMTLPTETRSQFVATAAQERARKVRRKAARTDTTAA